MHRNTTTQQGFTMIELIMVIVILGILAAVALPRFYNMAGDARAAKADALFGAVRSASAIAHSAALVTGQTGATGTIDMEGVSVGLVHGYPSSAGIVAAANLDATNDDVTIVTTGPTTITINGAATAADCRITYTAAASASTSPTIALVKTGC